MWLKELLIARYRNISSTQSDFSHMIHLLEHLMNYYKCINFTNLVFLQITSKWKTTYDHGGSLLALVKAEVYCTSQNLDWLELCIVCLEPYNEQF